MSSHHFVRENQEPGLYIDEWFAGAELLLEELAQWAPKIIVHERVLDDVLETGTKIDVVLYTDSKATIEEKTRFQFPIEIVKAEDLFEANVSFIEDNYINRVHIISLKKPEEITFQSGSQLTFFNAENTFYRIEKGFEKWMAQNSPFEILVGGKRISHQGNDALFHYEGKAGVFIE